MEEKDGLQILDPKLEYLEDVRQQHLAERIQLIDAARESARTFDKAVLTFGSAIFGFSIAFVKDVAPSPIPSTITWLAVSWLLFSVGLLAILLSFLFSHQACMFEIKTGHDDLHTLKERIKTQQSLNAPTTQIQITGQSPQQFVIM
ncbi:MAG TPA: hypothetical protein VKT33_14355 [Candidatus Angelobacter sp.]|nr:hypothetical protein [Candidatus Angelobacter sp.]